jgi:serine/threonine protein kinase
MILDRKKEDNPFKEEEIAKIIKYILNAILYMHEIHVIHRDLKPGKITKN